MESTHEAELPIPELPLQARKTHIFPALQETSLISVGQLCDVGCTATFDKHSAEVYYQGKIILQGNRNQETNGLWMFRLPQHKSNAAIPHSAKPSDLVQFAHQALFSPALSTLKTALRKGFLPPFRGLSTETLSKYPPNLEATMKGHMDATRQNLHSTKDPQADQEAAEKHLQDQLDEAFPEATETNKRTHEVYLAVTDLRGKIYTDQTGKLPTVASTGDNYIMIAYDYDSNAILLEPHKNRKSSALRGAYAKTYKRLTKGGCIPQLHILDNETSEEVHEFFEDQQVKHQYVKPHEHRCNAAERAIRTAKNHLIAGWASVDPNFPAHLWAHTIPQAELTLTCSVDPASTRNYLHGNKLMASMTSIEHQ